MSREVLWITKKEMDIGKLVSELSRNVNNCYSARILDNAYLGAVIQSIHRMCDCSKTQNFSWSSKSSIVIHFIGTSLWSLYNMVNNKTMNLITYILDIVFESYNQNNRFQGSLSLLNLSEPYYVPNIRGFYLSRRSIVRMYACTAISWWSRIKI